MSPYRPLDPYSHNRRSKNERRRRLADRVNHQHPRSTEETNVKQDRKNEHYERAKAAAAENAKFATPVVEQPIAEPAVVIDPLAEAEKRPQGVMTGPNAPSWARVTVNDDYRPAPASKEEIQQRLAQLDAEEAAL